jgi:hypothetical protein
MHTPSTPSLVQQWLVITDDQGSPRLVARWIDDSAHSEAAGIA